MILYTIGFTQKTAKQFFEKIKNNDIELLLDIRLNNASQLAGFTKGNDLAYFLKEICQCDYVHDIRFAPTAELLQSYRKGTTSWDRYVIVFDDVMKTRRLSEVFDMLYRKYNKVCLLCSEPTPDQCHRRLVAEMLQSKLNNIEIEHL